MSDDLFYQHVLSTIGAILGISPALPKQLGDVDPMKSEKRRRVPFDPTYGPKEERSRPPMRYIPGELDLLREQVGIASDDPYQLNASLEAWKQQGYGKKLER